MKNLLVVLLIAVLVVVLCACGKTEVKQNEENNEAKNNVEEVINNEEEQNEEVQSEVEETEGEEEYIIPVADEAVYSSVRVKYNGVEFGAKDKFDDIKEALGPESRPSQTYKPCAAFVEGEVTTHYYDGITIDTNSDGYIFYYKFSTYDNPNSTAELVTGIKLGSTPEEVLAAYGETDSANEYGITYNYENMSLGFSIDFDETGTINNISVESRV